MTIEIHKAELEALILQRMKEGQFKSVEDALMDALRSSIDNQTVASSKRTGSDLIAAMQASPHRDVEIEPERFDYPLLTLPNNGMASRYKCSL